MRSLRVTTINVAIGQSQVTWDRPSAPVLHHPLSHMRNPMALALAPLDMFKFVHLRIQHTGTPKTGCKVCGRHSTEIRSCIIVQCYFKINVSAVYL